MGLAVASVKFAVKRDPRKQEILDLLPGTNCGACGFAGCAAMAEAMAAGRAGADACPSAPAEAIQSIAVVMGVKIAGGVKDTARLMCRGSIDNSPAVAIYDGPADCAVMAATSGGGKACLYGCLGGGSCVDACIYGAMRMGNDGLPVIDEDSCTACGLCVKACPRSLIRLVRADKPVVVCCSSRDRGPEVRKVCNVGCIGCMICVKTCMDGAITVTDSLAVIDPDKCTVCGLCIPKCPQKIIIKM